MQNSFNPESAKYFKKLLSFNGKSLFGFQTSHVMIMYFIIQGLASNDSLDRVDRQVIISYIKSLQLPEGGFAPSSLYTNYHINNEFNLPHIVFTYSGNLRSIASCEHFEKFRGFTLNKQTKNTELSS